jgi:phage terminase large subunit-like protein
MLGKGFLDWLREQDDRTKTGLIGQLEERERALIRHDWPLWRREAQSPPRGAWNCWVICAGRGFGKTRTGAEWVRECAILDPDARIALVAASLGEARSVMVEGESGVLAICPPNYRPFYEPSLKRLTWPNGAMAFLYSAAEPESLRGPQHSHAWCDEIGKWPGVSGKAEAAWDNLAMGLRLGLQPKVVATTTPRATALVRRLVGEETRGLAHISRGTTRAPSPPTCSRCVGPWTARWSTGSTRRGKSSSAACWPPFARAAWGSRISNASRAPRSTRSPNAPCSSASTD